MRKRIVGELRPGDRAYSNLTGNCGIVEHIVVGTNEVMMVMMEGPSQGAVITYQPSGITPETFLQFICRKDGFGKSPRWVVYAVMLTSGILLGLGVSNIALGLYGEGIAELVLMFIPQFILWYGTVRNYYGKQG